MNTTKKPNQRTDRAATRSRQPADTCDRAEMRDAGVAKAIHELRVDAGLTQKELAELVGTSASVISRLEDSRYSGHSVAMLRRVAAALNREVQIRFVTSPGCIE